MIRLTRLGAIIEAFRDEARSVGDLAAIAGSMRSPRRPRRRASFLSPSAACKPRVAGDIRNHDRREFPCLAQLRPSDCCEISANANPSLPVQSKDRSCGHSGSPFRAVGCPQWVEAVGRICAFAAGHDDGPRAPSFCRRRELHSDRFETMPSGIPCPPEDKFALRSDRLIEHDRVRRPLTATA